MKNLKVLISSFAVASLLLTGCCKEQTPEVGYAKVKVHVDDFAFTQEEIPVKGTIAECTTIKSVTLAFYKADGSEQCKITQHRNDASTYGTTFGDFDLSLPMGSYTMVVLAHDTIPGCYVTLTSPISAVFTGDHALETFATTQAVNVTNTEALDISATLNRIVSKLQVISTDGKTANATNVRMTLSGGSRSFNPTTGLATDNNGFINTVGISAAVGDPSTSTTYLFLATDEETIDVTIDVLDASGNSISHKVVNNVPMKRNRVTKLTGSLYTTSAGSGFTVNTTWLDEHTISF